MGVIAREVTVDPPLDLFSRGHNCNARIPGCHVADVSLG